MNEETGSARDSFTAGSTVADQLITLIMSGTKPTVGADTQRETDPVPASLPTAIPPELPEPESRSVGPATPAGNTPAWAHPPAASRVPQPRVEAMLVRGPAQYRTHDASAPAHNDTDSTRKGVPAVAQTAAPPALQPDARTQAMARIPGVEAISLRIVQDRSHNAPAPEHEDASSARGSSEPQSRTTGWAITRWADRDEASGSTQPSALTAAIEPYLRPQPDSAAQEASDRERRGWRKT